MAAVILRSATLTTCIADDRPVIRCVIGMRDRTEAHGTPPQYGRRSRLDVVGTDHLAVDRDVDAAVRAARALELDVDLAIATDLLALGFALELDQDLGGIGVDQMRRGADGEVDADVVAVVALERILAGRRVLRDVVALAAGIRT